MTKPIVLVVCHHFEPEIRAVLDEVEMTDVIIRVFPGRCGHPPMEWEDFRQMQPDLRNSGQLHLAGGCCLARLNDVPEDFPQTRIHKFAQCFYMIAPQALVDAYLRSGAYLVTPGWLAHWKAAVREWGFDQKTAARFFQESATKIVLLDLGTDPQSKQRLHAFSKFVNLPDERVEIGTDFLRLLLSEIVLKARLSHTVEQKHTEEQQKADYMMILDFVFQLGDSYTEEQVIRRQMELLTMLLAPETVYFQSYRDGLPTCSYPEGRPFPPDFGRLRQEAKKQGEAVLWHKESGSMFIHIRYERETVGFVYAAKVAFPCYKAHYMDLARFSANIFGLTIGNARHIEYLETLSSNLALEKEKLEKTLEKVKQLSGLLPICSSCKKIRTDDGYWQDVAVYVRDHSEAEFSHGICPDCMKKLYPDYHKKKMKNTKNDAPSNKGEDE